MSYNSLQNHTGWGKAISATLRIWVDLNMNPLSTLQSKSATADQSWEKILRASIWEAVSFKTVTLNRFSSGVPDRCQILGTAGSNPWPSDCRWASVLYQTKSRLAGRCSLLCFLWYRNLCWSVSKQYCPRASYGKLFSSSFTIMFWGWNNLWVLTVKFCNFTTVKGTSTQLYSSHFITIGLLNSDYSQWPSWCIFLNLNP